MSFKCFASNAMTNPRVYILVLFLLIVAASCNLESKDSSKASRQEYINRPLSVELNEGKPWLANEETTQGIQNMKMLMDDFKTQAENESYVDLNEQLQEQFTLIFQRCTMTGEAHNQLHNYLIPINETFATLASENEDSSALAFRRLEFILSEYAVYFE